VTATLLDDAMAHHVWATERVLDACADLSLDQLRAPVPGTYGSILQTLAHLVSSDGWYLTFFRVGTNAIDEDGEVTFDELLAANRANGEAWLEVLAAGPDSERDMVEEGDGWDFHSPLGFRLAQVIHHGTDHRSQICTAMTGFGIEPPVIDLWAFGEATGRTRVVDLRAHGG
jgi:uncharacterized damage-inducible protein DinB